MNLGAGTYKRQGVDLLQMVSTASEAIQFISSNPRHDSSGSFAMLASEEIGKDPLHPYAFLMQHAQSYIYAAAENLKLVADIEDNFKILRPPIPLPMFSFFVLLRVTIENSAILNWVLSSRSEDALLERSISLGVKERDSYRRYLTGYHQEKCTNPAHPVRFDTAHSNISCAESWAAYFEQEEHSKLFANEHGVEYAQMPDMTSNDPNKSGLLKSVGGNQLDILYRQLSGSIHGNNWAFQLNSIKKLQETEQESNSIKSAIHSPDLELLDITCTVSMSLLRDASSRHRRLFTQNFSFLV